MLQRLPEERFLCMYIFTLSICLVSILYIYLGAPVAQKFKRWLAHLAAPVLRHVVGGGESFQALTGILFPCRMPFITIISSSWLDWNTAKEDVRFKVLNYLYSYFRVECVYFGVCKNVFYTCNALKCVFRFL